MDLKELLQKQMQGEIIIIDVRNEDEHKARNPLSSINIPLSSIGQNPHQITQFNKEIVLVCFSGRRSEIAQETIRNTLGLEVLSLNGGLEMLLK
tara:strand:+ start:564 stop:845 length:282 start_codon:yes stop_codon:yes gene_type:complete